MGMLAFFPWLILEEPMHVERFWLTPFQRGESPAGAGSNEQRLIDGVLAPFRFAHGPVNVATIVHFEGRAWTAELDEPARSDLFVFSQLVAFCGLAAREYCGLGFNYCNASEFSFIIQGFSEEPSGTFFSVRRRDGFKSVRVTADAYQVLAPPQATGTRIRLDVALLQAILSSRGRPLWNRVFEAIGPFLRANTDSSEMAEQSEVVEMVGAFERALGVWGDRLKGEFHRHFKPTADISPRDAPRIPPALRNGLSVRHLWMGDLYDLRNAHAHGDQVQPADLMWDRMEHLLLGAYAFPLLVKSLLSEEQLYQLTAQDQKAIDVFEPFARVKGHLLERLRDEGGNEHLRWDEVKSDFAWERVHAQLQGRATSRERDSDSGEAP